MIIPISFRPEKKNNSVTICKRCRFFYPLPLHQKRARAPKHTKKMKKKKGKKKKKNLRGRWRPRPGRYYQRRWLPGKGSFHRPGNQCSIDSNWCTSRWRRGRPFRRVSRGRRCRCRSARPIWSEAANRKCASRCPWPASRCSPSPSLALCNSSTEAFMCVCTRRFRQIGCKRENWINKTFQSVIILLTKRILFLASINDKTSFSDYFKYQCMSQAGISHMSSKWERGGGVFGTNHERRNKYRVVLFFFTPFCLVMRQATRGRRHRKNTRQNI